jgi:hypothetical protein
VIKGRAALRDLGQLFCELAGLPLAEIKLYLRPASLIPAAPGSRRAMPLNSRIPPLGVHPGIAVAAGGAFRSCGTYTVPRKTRGLGEYHLTPCPYWLPGPDSNQRPSG